MDDPANPTLPVQPQNPPPVSTDPINQDTLQGDTSLSPSVPPPPASSQPVFSFPSPDTNQPSPDLNASSLNIPPTEPSIQVSTADNSINPAPQPLPTFPPAIPPSTTPASQSPLVGSIDTTSISDNPLEVNEPAPTDLSQLTANANPPSSNNEVYTPPISTPETLVVPSSGNPIPTPTGATTTTSGERHTLPLIAIIGGVLVILAVAGASAYFILGIGKPQNQNSTSLPIVQPSQAPLTKPPEQIPTPAGISTPATSSPGGQTSFGSLNGESTSPTPSPTKEPTSAADLLKAKQSSSPRASASPKPSATPVVTP